RHVLRNALLPIITLAGLSFPALLTGAFFIEKIFSWPGMGYAVVNAIGTRDYPLVVGGVIVGSIMVTIGSLLADLLYAWADPRLRAD
ncbi:MAG: ABC transporter permease subunit, partial [Gemmatimonadaceae bacterium]